jgi:uncharacterized protein (DUF488 family)
VPLSKRSAIRVSKDAEANGAMRIFTVGHSTRAFDALVDLLHAHGVLQLADVRSYPGSRRHPQFARANLETALPAAGIAYRWLPGLGGRRKPAADSRRNAGWRVDGFRAYADHMQTEEFRSARSELEDWARRRATAVMCAEAIHTRCHRRLLADALLVRGWEVLHIESQTRAQPHVLTPFAVVETDGAPTYPGDPALPLGDRL